MKITKRQLGRIIKEELARHDGHAYDASKYELADHTMESDAVDEVLSDLMGIDAPQDIIDQVEEAQHYGEDLESVLSLVSDDLKDRMMSRPMPFLQV